MTHRGEIIENAVRKSGMTITLVAKRMGKSRRHLYNIFESPNVSIDVVLQIGKIIHHDFTSEIFEVKKIQVDDQVVNENHDNIYQLEKPASYWKDKYLNLLEKYNRLLEENNG